jgi:hypothetical protein
MYSTGFLYAALVGAGASGSTIFLIDAFNLFPQLLFGFVLIAEASLVPALPLVEALVADAHSSALTMATICASVSLLIRQIRAKIRSAAG